MAGIVGAVATKIPGGGVSRLSLERRRGCSPLRMAITAHRIVRAWLESLTSGVVELDRDWTSPDWPRFSFGEQCPAPRALTPAPALAAGRAYGYFLNP